MAIARKIILLGGFCVFLHAHGQGLLTLRAFQPLSALQQKVLAEISIATRRDVPANVDPFTILRAHCGGSFTNSYRDEVIKLNQGFVFGASGSIRELQLPACPHIDKNVSVTVLPGDTVDTITKRTLGVDADTPISVCDSSARRPNGKIAIRCILPAKDAIASINGGRHAGLDALNVGREITVPTVSRPETVALKPNVTIEEALLKLQNSSGSANPFSDLHQAPELKLLKPLLSDDSKILGTVCSPTEKMPVGSWPFDIPGLISILEANRKRLAERGRQVVSTVVRIADNGFVGLGTFFPKQLLSVNDFEVPNQAQDLDQNGFSGDYYGIDAAAEGKLDPYDGTDSITAKLHGTAVADLTLGGQDFRAAYPGLSSLMKIDFAKIFWKPGSFPIVNNSTMLSAMTVIKDHANPTIINFSVGGTSQSNTGQFVQTILQNSPQLGSLVIVAAGNSGQDIEHEVPVYPASYGGSGSAAASYMLTVGASNPDGKITSFSNESVNRVDLLAPGCRIKFVSPTGNVEYMHGTSAAAPLVSFAAALVHSLGVSDPIEIRQRIIASADYDRNDNSTKSHGVLNILRSVDLYRDTIQIESNGRPEVSGSVFRSGRWIVRDGVADICQETSIAARNVLRVDSLLAADGTRSLRVLMTGTDRRMGDPYVCKAKGSGIDFVGEDGVSKTIVWSDLVSLVPAFDLPEIR